MAWKIAGELAVAQSALQKLNALKLRLIRRPEMLRSYWACAVLSVFYFGANISAVGAECSDATLKNNIDSGRQLLTTSGELYDVLAGDNFDSMLWLPMSSLQVCGPRNLTYKGKTYQLYKVINTDDGESVEAFRLGKKSGSGASSSSCYASYIQEPTPFNGNGGELIMLADGSLWKETSYQYLYLYQYNPQVTMCPDKGLMILDSNKFSVIRVK